MVAVTIIDDDEDLRRSMKVLIQGSESFNCVSTYRDCETALQNIEDEQPDVILLDIEIPGRMSGLEGISLLKEKLPDTEIIMMTIHDDHDFVFKSLQNGASGYLLKIVDPIELLRAVREVYEGGSPMSMRIARMVTESFRMHPPSEPLSKREQQVLRKLCEGKSYQAIANELFIAKTTVKFHIRNIYKILHVTNKAAAVAKAKDERII